MSINGTVRSFLQYLRDKLILPVWHGKSRSYQDYKSLSGRFVSEFGMHGYPDMRTVNEFAPNPEDRHPQSRAIDSHNKGHLAETRIARYLAENFRYSNELEKFAYVSQLMQSEAYGYACRDWKRKFGGKRKESCAGLIIWQVRSLRLLSIGNFTYRQCLAKRRLSLHELGLHRLPSPSQARFLYYQKSIRADLSWHRSHSLVSLDRR